MDFTRYLFNGIDELDGASNSWTKRAAK